MTIRLGRTQEQIVSLLNERGGATNTWTMQTNVARCPSGHTQISRSAWRLWERGLLRREDDKLTENEQARLDQARKNNPRAFAFWILADTLA